MNFPPNLNQPNFESGGTRKYRSYDDTGSNAFTVTTDGAGAAFVYYTAPEICGTEIISAATNEPDAAARAVASVSVTTRADLAAAFASLSSSAQIELIGDGPIHPSSHWGTAALIMAIERLGQNYAVERTRGTVPNFPLAVNDMSLVHGGFFDIDGSWSVEGNKGHKGHRLGIEVDMGGASAGHGLLPAARVELEKEFDRMWQEQGWFKRAPEGDHYHFILFGDGRASILFPKPAVATWQDQANRLLLVHVPFENGGSLDAAQVTISNLQTSHGTLLTPLPIDAGGATRRTTATPAFGFDVLIQVPVGVKGLALRGGGTAVAPGGGSTPVPSPKRGPMFTQYVAVPAAGIASQRPAAPAAGGWTLTLTSANQPAAAAGTTVVYSGIIQNTTGSDIYLSTSDLYFTMSAPDASYVFDLAPEFLALGGVIPPAGYAGPLFTIYWVADPPLSASGVGSFSLVADPASGLPALAPTFESYYKPQTLRIARANGQIVLSWPVEASSMSVESSTGLDGENEWIPVTAPVVQGNGMNTITLPATDPAGYFRLKLTY